MLSKRTARSLTAQWRDFRILIGEFWPSLLVFSVVLLGGGSIFWKWYPIEAGERPLTFASAVWNTFMMVFFQTQLRFPNEWPLQALFFLIPLLGLGVVVEGFTRFGMLIVNKKLRGGVWQKIVASTYTDHIILCGLGHVGYRVAEQLRMLGQDFVVIAHESKFTETVKQRGVPVIIGDIRDETLLDAVNVLAARTIIIATDNDLANLEVLVNARERNPRIRTIVRLFDADLGRKMQKSLGIDMVFSTSTLAAPAVAMGALSETVLHSFYVGSELLSMAELQVTAACGHAGRTLEDVERALRITVVVHRSGERVRIHPQGGDVVQDGDHIVFLGNLDTIRKMEEAGFRATASTTASLSGLLTALPRG